MTTKQIEERRDNQARKFAIALELKAILAAHRKAYGAADWDDDDMDSEIATLVFDEA